VWCLRRGLSSQNPDHGHSAQASPEPCSGKKCSPLDESVRRKKPHGTNDLEGLETGFKSTEPVPYTGFFPQPDREPAASTDAGPPAMGPLTEPAQILEKTAAQASRRGRDRS